MAQLARRPLALVQACVLNHSPERSNLRARAEDGLQTTNHGDMHGGELETSMLLHIWPDQVRPGYENADTDADDRRALLTRGTVAYTTTGIIGRPSLASAPKGAAVLRSLAAAFVDHMNAVGPPD